MRRPDVKKAEDVNTPMIALVGILGAILLFVVTIGIEAWIRSHQEEENYRKVISPPNEELSQLQAKQLESINGYRMVDTQKNIVAIPIDRAMELVVEDLATTGTRAQEGGKNGQRKDD